MKKYREYSLSFQTISYTTGLGIQFFGQWLISVLLVRMDSFATAGSFSLAITVSNIFAFIANYGIRSFQVTDVNRVYSDQQYMLARALTVGFSLILCTIYLKITKDYSAIERSAIMLYLLYQCVNTISDTLLGSLQVRNHLEVNGFADALRGLMCFAAFMTVFVVKKNILLALLSMVGATVVVLLAYELPIYHNLVKGERHSQDIHAALKLIKICAALSLSQILPLITVAIPRRAIQRVLGIEALGVFSSIFSPTLIISTMISIVITALLPRIAAIWDQRDIKLFFRMTILGLAALLTLFLILCMAAWLMGRPVLSLLYGESILPFYPLIYFAIATTVLNSAVVYVNGLLTAIRHMPVVAVCSGVALLISVLVSNRMVKYHGVYGAASSVGIAYIMQCILLLTALCFYTTGGKNN